MNPHHARISRLLFLVTLHGRTLGGTADKERALSLLAVLSRDGELSGYELVTRGAR